MRLIAGSKRSRLKLCVRSSVGRTISMLLSATSIVNKIVLIIHDSVPEDCVGLTTTTRRQGWEGLHVCIGSRMYGTRDVCHCPGSALKLLRDHPPAVCPLV